MTDGDLDFLGQADWRKRIHQLKQDLRSATTEPSLSIPEQVKPDGTELKPKRDRHSGKPASPNARSHPRLLTGRASPED